MLRPLAGRDEQRRAGPLDIGGVPDARRIDRVLAWTEPNGRYLSVGLLLAQDQGSRRAQHDLRAGRMHLPGGPGGVEGMHADEPPLPTVTAMTRRVALVPGEIAGEPRLDRRGRAEPEMDRIGGDVDCTHARLP